MFLRYALTVMIRHPIKPQSIAIGVVVCGSQFLTSGLFPVSFPLRVASFRRRSAWPTELSNRPKPTDEQCSGRVLALFGQHRPGGAVADMP